MTEEEKKLLMQMAMMGKAPSQSAVPTAPPEGSLEGSGVGGKDPIAALRMTGQGVGSGQPLSDSFGASSPQGEPLGVGSGRSFDYAQDAGALSRHTGDMSVAEDGKTQGVLGDKEAKGQRTFAYNLDDSGTEVVKKIGQKEVNEAVEILMKYKDGKANLENRIVDEERWWKLRHWEQMNNADGRPKPASAWLFNAVVNKHADAMDSFPEPNILPRALDDEESAQTLSSVVPVIMERNNFEKVYSDEWWYKLKHGVGCYGVFWNNDLENGLGDIEVANIDILNVFWEPGIRDIQDSRNFFVVAFADEDVLKKQYPQLADKNIGGNVLDVKEYIHDENIDKSQKCVVVDWYYKTSTDVGRSVLHYCKFVGDTVLFATENEERYKDTGLYEHGMYPFVLDVMYPEADSPAGFGVISITRDAQMYIDKLQQLIIENAAYSATPRYWIRKDSGINEEEFLDLRRTLVHVEGSIDEEKLRRIEMDSIPPHILNLLQFKIDELKDTSSNHDVSQGSLPSTQLSGAAIAALQETGNKNSRDIISASYRSYTQVVYLVIELIRQFYSEPRNFRITGMGGEPEFVRVDNQGIKANQNGRKPVFDVVVKPQKRSAYSKLAQNDLMIQMYQLGILHPQNADAALVAVEGMEFDGKEKLKQQLQKGQTMYMQMQQMGQQMQMQAAQMEKMAMIIEKLTGESVGKQPSQSLSAPALP